MIISIGLQCTNKTFTNKIGKKSHTLPFDWMFATPEFVFKMLVLLLEKNMEIDELVTKHFFVIDKKLNLEKGEHYYTCEDGFAQFNSLYNAIFPHENTYQDSIEKYKRRFHRLKNLILNNEQDLIFIYSSQSSLSEGNLTLDEKELVKKVYFYLSKIYNLIEKYNHRFKIIVFDTLQIEQKEDLNSNIKLIHLEKCSNWGVLELQMEKYIHLFE